MGLLQFSLNVILFVTYALIYYSVYNNKLTTTYKRTYFCTSLFIAFLYGLKIFITGATDRRHKEKKVSTVDSLFFGLACFCVLLIYTTKDEKTKRDIISFMLLSMFPGLIIGIAIDTKKYIEDKQESYITV